MEIIEILFVFGIILLIFGPTKLPEIARGLGNAIHEFQVSSSGINTHLNENDDAVRESIIKLAKNLQVEVEGKNIKQISDEILTKIDAKAG